MFTQNLHAHSTWDDGHDTPEEMILASRAAGLDSVGLSLHSPMDFENDWAAKPQSVTAFVGEMARLREKYEGTIRVYTGIEWDVLSRVDLSAFDYVIGSVHHLPLEGWPAVDDSPETTRRFLEEFFAGDADAAARMYFAQYVRIAQEPRVNIVGHFDLLTKFDERCGFFDAQSPAYRGAALEAMEMLVRAGKIFEVNTGAISRGYRTTPYPSKELLCALRDMGGRVTISADAHAVTGVACAFEQAEALIRACGFAEVWRLEGEKFVPVGLK